MVEGDAHQDLGFESWLQERAEEEEREQLRERLDAEAQPVSDAVGDGDLQTLAAYLKRDALDLPGLPEGIDRKSVV